MISRELKPMMFHYSCKEMFYTYMCSCQSISLCTKITSRTRTQCLCNCVTPQMWLNVTLKSLTRNWQNLSTDSKRHRSNFKTWFDSLISFPHEQYYILVLISSIFNGLINRLVCLDLFTLKDKFLTFVEISHGIMFCKLEKYQHSESIFSMIFALFLFHSWFKNPRWKTMFVWMLITNVDRWSDAQSNLWGNEKQWCKWKERGRSMD